VFFKLLGGKIVMAMVGNGEEADLARGGSVSGQATGRVVRLEKWVFLVGKGSYHRRKIKGIRYVP
jgi:hypothetical protein